MRSRGLGLAAIRSSSLLSTQFVFTVALSLLLVSLVGAIVGKPRSFWVGAAVFGWGYGILAFGPWFSENVEPWLLTTRILDELFMRFIAPVKIYRGRGLISIPGIGNPAARWVNHDEYIRFIRTGHSLSLIVHCVAGGFIGLILDHRKNRPGSPDTRVEVS